MRSVRAWLLRLIGVFRKSRSERDFAEELESHLEMHIADGIRSGLTPEEARRQAVLKLGGIDPVKESYRDRRGIPWLETLARDVTYSFRIMRLRPGFTATVMLTLALGIGATTAIFTIVNGVLLRPLPYPDPDRLVHVSHRLSGPGALGRSNLDSPFSYTPNYDAWKQHSRSFSLIAGYQSFQADFARNGEAERIACGFATESLLPLLGVQPVLGRRFLPEEDRPGGPPVAMLEYAFWNRRFGGSRSALGQPLTLDGESYTIIGVLPRGFRIPDQYRLSDEYSVWVPLGSATGDRRARIIRVVGRLKPGVSLEAARSELDGMQRTRLRPGVTERILLKPWHEQVASQSRRALLLFLAAVGCVLVIACVNVANLLLSRASSRGKEMAVRRALGAGRARILRQLLTESVVIASLGGALGLLLAWSANRLLLALLKSRLPNIDPIGLDPSVLGFAVALSVLTGLAFGVAPALYASRVQVSESLKEAGRGAGPARCGGRLRSALVVLEVALAMVLLNGGGLLLHSFLKVRGLDLGFKPERVLALDIDLSETRYREPRDRVSFVEQVLRRIEELPGVQSASGGAFLPLGNWTGTYNDLTVEGRPGLKFDVFRADAAPGYFRTVGIPVILGRDFTPRDRDGAPAVAIVNESFARRYLSKGRELGTRISNPFEENGWMMVVGVIGDVRHAPEREPEPQLYLPYLQAASPNVSFVVRTAGDPMHIASAVRARIASVDSTQPPEGVETLGERRDAWIVPRRANMLLISAFAGLALTLGAIGIYGVLAYAVGQRTHEIGVRMALGAGQGQIAGMVLRKGLVLIAAGIAIGAVACLGLMRLIASELWGVSARDPITYAAVASVLALTGIAASWLPARRAARVEPVLALHHE